ncbi:MFS transporter [Thermococcus aciditolerans]|uniref:MFS transporter n=1 Tax=Thermococcus aciditolerans TaxID=2598455 RepID=A0A5C0SLT7_9EURY|nr:MFS transporter [Thermococcus aciditolerans]QEK14706.1 MFS transporter [Thermococcus aciditolerans]
MGQSKWGVLIIMSAALFIMFIDTTMMNVSISALVRDLDTTVAGVQGAITLYSLVMAAFMITGAKLADIWWTKKVFFRGLVIYTVGTLMAAFAPNLAVLLLGWSILEGIGASMMMPATVTYITKAYTGKDRAFAFGVWGGVGGAAAAFGPIIGGFFTTYITWRLGFFMEAIIAVGIFYGMRMLHDYRPEKVVKLDTIGAALVGVGLFLLTLSVLIMDPLSNPPVLLLMVAGLVVLAAFWKYEKRRKERGEDVLIDIDIFKSRVFTVANLVSIFFQLTLAGIMFTIPVFVQQYLHYNAIQTGFVVVPLSIMMFIFSMSGQRFARYLTPKQIIQLGIVLTFVGLYLVLRVLKPGVTGSDFAPGLALYGMGFGLIFSQITNLAMMGAKPEQQADASGIFNAQKQFGLSLGTAFIGAVLILGIIHSITRQIYESGVIEGSKEQIKEAVIQWIIKMQQGELNIPPEYHDAVIKIVRASFIDTMKVAVLFMMGVLVISALLSFFLPKGEKAGES